MSDSVKDKRSRSNELPKGYLPADKIADEIWDRWIMSAKDLEGAGFFINIDLLCPEADDQIAKKAAFRSAVAEVLASYGV